MDTGETPEQSANRELQEEIGFGAKKWTFLRTMKINPQIMSHKMHVLLGEDLYPNKLEGDEPEPLEIVRYLNLMHFWTVMNLMKPEILLHFILYANT